MYAARTMRERPNLLLTIVAVLAATAACNTSANESRQHTNIGIDNLNAKAYSPAQKEFEQALTLDPENDIAAYSLGEVFTRQNKWDRAVDPLLQAIKHNDKSARYHFKLGETYYHLEKYDMSRSELERTIALEKNYYMAHWLLGRIDYRDEKVKEAAEQWTEACRLDPHFGKPFFDLGKLYYEWGDMSRAVTVLEQGAQYVKDPEDLTNISYMLGLAYDQLGQFDKSAKAYEAALEAKKDNMEARLQLGLAYYNKGDFKQAQKYLDEFVRLGGGGNSFNISAANDRLSKMMVAPNIVPH